MVDFLPAIGKQCSVCSQKFTMLSDCAIPLAVKFNGVFRVFQDFGVRLDFVKSDANNYPQITYTYPSPVDLRAWRYLISRFYNVRPAGGNTTRTLTIVLTDVSAQTRTYSITGNNAIGTDPFGITGWVTLQAEILNPTTTSTTFDLTNVASISLRMNDGANRAGSLWWDNVRFEGALTNLFRAFFQANSTFQTTIDPVEPFATGETLTYIIRNMGSSSGDFSVYSTGVAL
jgi:hypothetical protein